MPAKYFTGACKIPVSLEKREKISFLYKGEGSQFSCAEK
jgi:hypothetical protein